MAFLPLNPGPNSIAGLAQLPKSSVEFAEVDVELDVDVEMEVEVEVEVDEAAAAEVVAAGGSTAATLDVVLAEEETTGQAPLFALLVPLEAELDAACPEPACWAAEAETGAASLAGLAKLVCWTSVNVHLL